MDCTFYSGQSICEEHGGRVGRQGGRAQEITGLLRGGTCRKLQGIFFLSCLEGTRERARRGINTQDQRNPMEERN